MKYTFIFGAFCICIDVYDSFNIVSEISKNMSRICAPAPYVCGGDTRANEARLAYVPSKYTLAKEHVYITCMPSARGASEFT
jgi:hypothetical protein